MADDWRGDLEFWLAPFLAALRHKTRMRLCPAYIAGLIGPGDRKSVQPMAARDGEFGYDQLHHFVAEGVWDSAPLETILLKEADRLVGDEAGFLATPRNTRSEVRGVVLISRGDGGASRSVTVELTRKIVLAFGR